MPFMSFLPEGGHLPDLFQLKPERFTLLLPVVQQIMRGPSELSEGEREYVFAYASGLNACTYCYGSHTATAEAYGLDTSVFETALEDLQASAVDEKMKPLLAYVRKLTEEPSRLLQKDADAVTAAGWSEDALHDAICVCALANMFNRIVDGHGIEGGGADMFKMAGQELKEHGYMAEEV